VVLPENTAWTDAGVVQAAIDAVHDEGMTRLRALVTHHCPPETRNRTLAAVELADLALAEAAAAAAGRRTGFGG
jgi:hypothetical protein